MSALRFSLPLVLMAALFAGCPDAGKRPLGDSCSSDGDCVSGLCAANLCLDPARDDDLDGITNGVEAALGSNPLEQDSDFDGQLDGDELASDQAGIDTDGDGKLDVVESRTRDSDGDCIPDQFDAQDDVPNTDLSPMRPVVCRMNGICAEQQDALRVACPDGVAICIYDDVVGYAQPEASCDQIDENCDGRVDEGFPENCEYFDWDNDGIKDAVDRCPETPDVGQQDSDNDGIGDACSDLYEVAFEPTPPTALTVGEAFSVAGVVRRKGAGNGAPMPTFRGRITLVTSPQSDLRVVVAPVANAFAFESLSLTKAGTLRFQLQSTLATAESGDVVVKAGPATSLTLIAPARVTAGEGFDVNALATDRFGNNADFNAAASLEADTAGAIIPPVGGFANGAWALSGMTLAAPGDTVLTLSAGQFVAQATVRVNVGPIASVTVELPSTVAAAATVPVTITVRDASGNIASNFTGVVSLLVDDPRSNLPASVTFTPQNGGQQTLSVRFGTLGLRTISATLDGFASDAQTTVVNGAPHHLVLTTDGPAMTGVPKTVTVAVVDAYDHPIANPAAPYLGTVSFAVGGSVPDLAPSLPAPKTFTAADLGTLEVSTTWYRQGVWRLRATGTGLAVPSATLAIEVSQTPGMVLELSVPPNTKAGVPADVTVTVRDGRGNVATGFTGMVVLADDDNRSDLPSFLALDASNAGTRTIRVTFVTPGPHTVTARVGQLSASADTVVLPGAPYAIVLSAPSPAVVGQLQAVQVNVVDRYGNLATDPADTYLGTASFDLVGNPPSVPPILPAPFTFLPTNKSVASAEMTWQQSGAFTLRVTGTDLEVPQATVQVSVVLATALEVSLPATVKSGVPVEVTVRALGRNATTASNFVGAVSLRDDDSRSVLPAALQFTAADGGVKTFTTTFFTVGARTVTASANGLSGSGSTNVLAGAPAAIRLSVSARATTGLPQAVRVTVVDAVGQVANDPADAYAGTVSFDVAGTQPEVAPNLPAATTFSAADLSQREFDVTWLRVGTFTLRVTGTGLARPSATANVEVIGTPANSIELSLPATTTSDTEVSLTVTVRDANGGIATGFADTIRLTSSGGSTLPSTITLGANDAGTRTIKVRFGRAGINTVTATWQAVSARAFITVLSGRPYGIVLIGASTTTTGVSLPMRVVIVDASGNAADNPATPYLGTVSFTSTGPTPPPPRYLPPMPPNIPQSRVFTAADAGNASFSTQWFRPGGYDFRATGTNLTRASASLGINVSVGAATMLDIIAPTTFVAATYPSAEIHATDAYRNIVDSFDDNVTVGGSDELYQDELEMIAGVARPPLTLSMRTAGDYVITADGGGLHGEAAVTVTPGPARFIVVTGPEEVSQDDNMTLHVRITDDYDNTATDFDGNVMVASSGQYSFYDANPIQFSAVDQGERDFLMRIFIPGPQTVSFSAVLGGTTVANHSVTVLSNLWPSVLSVQPAEDPIYANVPYAAGFVMQLLDQNGYPTAFPAPVTITASLGEMAPGPASLTGTLSRVIPAGRSSVMFDDLAFNRDGRFTLVARPDIDLSSGESDRFIVRYREPEVTVTSLTDESGCIRIAYSVKQADDMPVDVDVQFYNGRNGYVPARQAASKRDVSGHYQLPTLGGPSYSYLWNAAHDQPEFNGSAYVFVRARAGSRYIDNPWGIAYDDVPFATAGRICQSDVSAMLAAPAWPTYDETDTFGLGIAPRTFAAGDLNGDGKLDLVLGHADVTGVAIAYGRGDGGFEPEAVVVPSTPSTSFTASPLDVALGDFDGDGRTDVATASALEGIEIMRQGDAGLEPFGYFANAPNLQRMAAGDLDGNGVDDLVYVDSDNNITVAYSDGATFTHTVVGQDGAYVVALEVMNADNHGGLDIAYQALFWGDGLNQEICVITTSVDRSSFSSPVCRTVLYDTQTIANFTVDPNPLDNRIFFIRENDGYASMQALVFGNGFDNYPEYINACDYSDPTQFAMGNFEPWSAFASDPTTDLATNCTNSDGYGSFNFFMMSEDTNATFSVYDIAFDDNATLIAKDFTGDGADDIATRRGVLRTLPAASAEGSTRVRAPMVASSGTQDEAVLLAGDFDGDTHEGIFVVSVSGYNGSVYLELIHSEIYPIYASDYDSLTLCASQCPDPSSFKVLAAKGDINGDGLPDVVYATGDSSATGVVGALVWPVDGDGFEHVVIPPLGGDFFPATLAVGDLFGDGDRRDDIAVGGYNSDGMPQLVVFHWDANAGAFVRYEYSGDQLPDEFRESFIGDFLNTNNGSELVLVGRDPAANAVAFAPLDCTPQNPVCISAVSGPTSLLGGSFPNAVVDGVAAGDLEGNGKAVLLLQTRFGEATGTAYELRSVDLNVGGETLVRRSFEGPQPCKVGASYGCAEPALGPLVGDLDRDGTDDLLIGWEQGRNWEALTSHSHYMFGGTVSQRGQHALLSDIDTNGLLDVLVFELDSYNMWILGQDLFTAPSGPN